MEGISWIKEIFRTETGKIYEPVLEKMYIKHIPKQFLIPFYHYHYFLSIRRLILNFLATDENAC